MEQTTKYFILKDSGLHHIPDMPDKKDLACSEYRLCGRCIEIYNERLQKAIASSIPVANEEEVKQKIKRTHADSVTWEFLIGEIYPIECEVEIMNECDTCACHAPGCKEQKFEAFVKLKEETKEEVKHEIFEGCPCVVLDKPCKDNCSCVNIYSSAGCSYCAKYGSIEQRRFAAERISSALQDAVTKEEEQHKIWDSVLLRLNGAEYPRDYNRIIQELKSNFIITKRH